MFYIFYFWLRFCLKEDIGCFMMVMMTMTMMTASMMIGRGGKKWNRVNERGRRGEEEERGREKKKRRSKCFRLGIRCF